MGVAPATAANVTVKNRIAKNFFMIVSRGTI
jgi:hypothetical protein